jgi:hypothetical protein
MREMASQAMMIIRVMVSHAVSLLTRSINRSIPFATASSVRMKLLQTAPGKIWRYIFRYGFSVSRLWGPGFTSPVSIFLVRLRTASFMGVGMPSSLPLLTMMPLR